jgi:delta-aminolevulinic acid dehydratase/porphobilinogen synthase
MYKKNASVIHESVEKNTNKMHKYCSHFYLPFRRNISKKVGKFSKKFGEYVMKKAKKEEK